MAMYKKSILPPLADVEIGLILEIPVGAWPDPVLPVVRASEPDHMSIPVFRVDPLFNTMVTNDSTGAAKLAQFH